MLELYIVVFIVAVIGFSLYITRNGSPGSRRILLFYVGPTLVVPVLIVAVMLAWRVHG